MSFEGPTRRAGEGEEIPRVDTLIRLLISVVFLVILRVVETVLWVLVAFGLAYTLVTQQEPSPGVRRFSNRTLSYVYRIWRYVTYNEDTAPFPFRGEFPAEVEPVPRDDLAAGPI